MEDSIERLGFELSVAALAEQERALTGLRARAATVLGTASVSGSLASTGATHGGLDFVTALAMLAFVMALLSSLWILLPHELGFSVRGADVLHPTESLDVLGGLYREAAAWIDGRVQENRARLRRLALWLTASCLLLSIEIVLFGISMLR